MKFFGVTVMRHPRMVPGGPMVWTILVRVGRQRLIADSVTWRKVDV